MPYQVDIERFWAKVATREAGCWEWRGTLNNKGYGMFQAGVMSDAGNNVPQLAHRIAWFLATGRMPEMFILHRCDNPKCVRPSHLFEGTHDDNMADMSIKGRHWATVRPEAVKRGAEHYLSKRPELRKNCGPRSRFTSEVMRAIQLDRLAGMSFDELAAKYQISRTHACRIAHRPPVKE